MNTDKRTAHSRRLSRGRIALLASLALVAASGLIHMGMAYASTPTPPTEEFGLGPRTSTQGLYLASLDPAEPLRPRRIQVVRIALQDAAGRPVNGAAIAVDGGMPKHGHGLPTRPQVTSSLGDGIYELQGLRFNMGGWWELTLTIDGASGVDRVTFNLEI